jgi:hypothetical protein
VGGEAAKNLEEGIMQPKVELTKRATEALIARGRTIWKGAALLKDEVLIASFRASLDKLRSTLGLLIPPEFEELYVEDNETDTESTD